jgi:hypothetical protein
MTATGKKAARHAVPTNRTKFQQRNKEKVMKLAIALATACALLSAPAFAQSQTAPSTTVAAIGTIPARYLVP